ncbi:hypothetical protein C0Q70_00761 [Pomacea canaliculata]|uniref:Uncharacterized protein n=1 Tax=Pomacea canaliculata TaxID=400727 RepID=A0A2T7PXM7_POMCA|nr:hypothetical protein C0Q70_00761 [Pomacea canaliculata]
MRLPSHTFDKSDLMRSVSMTADGPEEIIEAEDYLQPQEPQHSPTRSSSRTTTRLQYAPLLPQGAVNYPLKAEKGEVSGLPWREKNYAHLNAAVEARKQRQQSPKRGREDSFNSRYSSDPIKFFREREEIEGPSSYPLVTNQNGSPTRKSSPTKVLQLAVDEDNYLAPHSTNPVMYTDLSDKGYYQNEKVFEEYRDAEDEYETDHMLKSSPLHTIPAVANPEYFDHDDDDVWETKPTSNGRLPSNAPAFFKPAPESAKCIYYNDLPQDLITIENVGGSGGGGVGVDGGSRGFPAGRVTVREQRPSESRV